MKIEITVPVAKASSEQQLVFGWANVSVTKDGKALVDHHDDLIPPDVLEKAAYNYVIRHREGGLEHQVMGVAQLAESVFMTPEKLKAMGIKDAAYKGAAWWVGFRVIDPEVWKAVKAGDLPMFSIGGTCLYEEEE